MANLTVQPSLDRPVPKKECLKYCIIPTGFAGDGGAYATASITFDGKAYAAGLKFIFCGEEFTTTNTTITRRSFPITSDPVESAENFIESLEKNILFYGIARITKVDGIGESTVTVRFLEAEARENWEFDFSELSPEPVHSESPGVTPIYTPGYKLRYQLWAKRHGDYDAFPVTNLEALTPRGTGIGIVPRVCLDFKDDVKGLVATTFPGSVADITLDSAFFVSVWLKYGGYIFSGCQETQFDWLTSNQATLLNSVVQIDDEEKLSLYNYADALFALKFLTSRPESMSVPTDANMWLWVYATHMQFPNLEKIRVRYRFYDNAGASIGDSTSASEPDEVGVYFFPCGPGNTPGIPAGTAEIRVSIEAYSNLLGSEGWVQGSSTYTITVSRDKCLGVEMYFIEDLGGYSTIHFSEVEEVTHNVEAQLSSLPEVCADSLYDRDLTARLQTGGFSRANIKSWKTFQASITGYDTPELERWFRQFLDSENILWRYISDTGDAVIRKIILEPGETVISRHDEYLTMEITFRFHTDLR